MDSFLEIIKPIVKYNQLIVLIVVIVGVGVLYKNREENEDNLIVKLMGYFFLGAFVFDLKSVLEFRLIVPIGFLFYIFYMMKNYKLNREIKHKAVILGIIAIIITFSSQYFHEEIVKREKRILEVGGVKVDNKIVCKYYSDGFDANYDALPIIEVPLNDSTLLFNIDDEKTKKIEVYYDYYCDTRNTVFRGNESLEIDDKGCFTLGMDRVEACGFNEDASEFHENDYVIYYIRAGSSDSEVFAFKLEYI